MGGNGGELVEMGGKDGEWLGNGWRWVGIGGYG